MRRANQFHQSSPFVNGDGIIPSGAGGTAGEFPLQPADFGSQYEDSVSGGGFSQGEV